MYCMHYIHSCVRIDVGGKVLTNLLKDMISYRHLNVMQETYLVNLIKHDMCCVASDLHEYLERAQCAHTCR